MENFALVTNCETGETIKVALTAAEEAQIEKDTLITQLRENLEELGRKNQFEIRKNEADYHQDMLKKVPLKLYVG